MVYAVFGVRLGSEAGGEETAFRGCIYTEFEVGVTRPWQGCRLVR